MRGTQSDTQSASQQEWGWEIGLLYAIAQALDFFARLLFYAMGSLDYWFPNIGSYQACVEARRALQSRLCFSHSIPVAHWTDENPKLCQVA